MQPGLERTAIFSGQEFMFGGLRMDLFGHLDSEHLGQLANYVVTPFVRHLWSFFVVRVM